MAKRFIFTLLLSTCFMVMPSYSQNDNSILAIENWEFSKATENEWLPIKAPGNVYTALFQNGKIPDPFLSDNEAQLQWIGETDWKFRAEFDVSSSYISGFDHHLIFEGLDTYAEVKLNGIKILTTDNMFRSWEVYAAGLIKPGKNIIEISFTSPVNYIKSINRPLSIVFPGGERVLTRKAQYQFGWDWAPTYITMGIIKPIYFKRWKSAFIDNIDISYELENTTAWVNLEAKFNVLNHGVYTVRFSIDDKEVASELEFSADIEQVNLSLVMYDIKLWWPNGLGDQNLYKAKLELIKDGVVLESKTQNIGFRKIDLIKEKDKDGESFFFKINGKPFFAKGANYVPPSSFPDQVDSLKLDVLIREAKEINFNMLRVWGGGYYESDLFYELCDKYGILVWQDFMFACAMYPDEKDLIENIQLEAEENVKRISWHPSLALWCGNNEISEGWANWGWKDAFNQDQQNYLAKAYDNIFNKVLPDAVNAFGHGLPYHESSPTFGRGDKRYKFIGDAHDWWVWHDSKPFEHFLDNVPRFMSEFGYQSYPDMATIKAFAGNNPQLTDPVLGAHQKHPRGNELIKSYMEKEYLAVKDFESFVYLSQRLQAEGIGMGIEAQRLAMPYCMGSLYWQYNDCWPSVSWSSVDYYGRWKSLQFKVKRLFAPVLLVENIKNDTVVFQIVSDLPEDKKLHLYTDIYNLNGDFLFGGLFHLNVKSNTSAVYNSQDLKAYISKIGIENLCIASRLLNDIGEVVSEDLKFLLPVKELKLAKSEITYEVKQVKEGYLISLNSKVVSPGVWISTDIPGKLSDNYFDMLPGDKEVMFYTKEILKDPQKDFMVRSLRDSWE